MRASAICIRGRLPGDWQAAYAIENEAKYMLCAPLMNPQTKCNKLILRDHMYTIVSASLVYSFGAMHISTMVLPMPPMVCAVMLLLA